MTEKERNSNHKRQERKQERKKEKEREQTTITTEHEMIILRVLPLQPREGQEPAQMHGAFNSSQPPNKYNNKQTIESVVVSVCLCDKHKPGHDEKQLRR